MVDMIIDFNLQDLYVACWSNIYPNIELFVESITSGQVMALHVLLVDRPLENTIATDNILVCSIWDAN